MATWSKLTRKDGSEYYKVQFSRGRGKSKLYRTWDPPQGVSARTVQTALDRFIRDTEKEIEAGTALSKKEQKAAEAQAAAEAAKIQTVKQYAEKVFMPQLSIHAAENTRDSYQRNLELHIYPAIGAMKMPEVTTAQLNALLLEFQSNGHAISSCVKLYTILQGLFKSAFMDDTLVINPMLKVRRPKATKAEIVNNTPKAYNIDEIKGIYAALKSEPLKWQLYVSLLADTGCRRGEAGGLCWDCVDTKNKVIRIQRTVNYTVEKGTYISTPKSKQVRQIPISAELAALFEQWKKEQSRDCLSHYVFNQKGSPEVMQAQTPTRYFKKFGEKYGFADMHPHKLRHSLASIALQQGADIVSVSALLGHSDPAVTLRVYSHADEESKLHAANIFRQALKKSDEQEKAGEG